MGKNTGGRKNFSLVDLYLTYKFILNTQDWNKTLANKH